MQTSMAWCMEYVQQRFSDVILWARMEGGSSIIVLLLHPGSEVWCNLATWPEVEVKRAQAEGRI